MAVKIGEPGATAVVEEAARKRKEPARVEVQLGEEAGKAARRCGDEAGSGAAAAGRGVASRPRAASGRCRAQGLPVCGDDREVGSASLL